MLQFAGPSSEGAPVRTVYATQFQLAAPRAGSAALRSVVGNLARDWVARFYPEPIPLPLDGGEVAPQEGHSIRIEVAPQADAAQHWSLRWQRPSASHPVGWEAILTLAQAGSIAELSCVVRQQGTRKPTASALHRPGVVRDAIEQLRCSAGGLALRSEPEWLSAAGVPAFVTELLLSPERVLPVLVVCAEAPGGEPSIEPAVLADLLVGLTHLAVLEDEHAAHALTAAIGKPLSCGGGAARLYAPGFTTGADPAEHPVFRPRTTPRAATLPDLILQRLTADATARFEPGAITRAAREALGLREEGRRAKGRSRDDRAAAPAPAPTEAPPADAPPDQTLLERIVAENEALARRKAELEQQTLDLELELEESRAALEAAKNQLEAERLALASRPIEGRAGDAGAEEALASVTDAVALAKVRFSERLLFLPSAETSAAASPFQNARRAFEALSAVDEVAGLRRASIVDRTSVGSMEALFQSRGFLYKAHESMTARGRWGEEYQVVFEGRKESIEEHVAIGTGGPESCLRIHFFWDAPSLRFVLAHVGRHKTNTRS